MHSIICLLIILKVFLIFYYYIGFFNDSYRVYLVLLRSMDVFCTLNLSVFKENWLFYKCLSLSMDFQPLSVLYYKQGRKLSCYLCYDVYIGLFSQFFFFPDVEEESSIKDQLPNSHQESISFLFFFYLLTNVCITYFRF